VFLVPSRHFVDLYAEFCREQRLYFCLKFMVYGLGWCFFLLYLTMIFGAGVRDPKYLLLDLLGLLYRVSGILLYKVFEIPNVLAYRFDPDPWLSSMARKTLNLHRFPILHTFFLGYYGKFYDKKLLEICDEELDRIVNRKLYGRYPWKSYAGLFFPSLFSFTIFVVNYLF